MALQELFTTAAKDYLSQDDVSLEDALAILVKVSLELKSDQAQAHLKAKAADTASHWAIDWPDKSAEKLLSPVSWRQAITPLMTTPLASPRDQACDKPDQRDNNLRLYNLEDYTQDVLDDVVFDYLQTHPNFSVDKINCSPVRAKKYGNFPRNVIVVHWAHYYGPEANYWGAQGVNHYCAEQACDCSKLTAPAGSACPREHWRFLVELANGNFVLMRASCLTSFSVNGYIEAYLDPDPRELIAKLTPGEYHDYCHFSLNQFRAYFTNQNGF